MKANNKGIDKAIKIFRILLLILVLINAFSYLQKRKHTLKKADYKVYVQETEGSSNYVEQEGSVFPTQGYNLSNYTCSNNSTITQNSIKRLSFSGSGDSCTLYFDIDTVIVKNGDTTLAYLNALNSNISSNSGSPNFSNLATTDEGIYSAEDDYGTSYYWRGAATTNYVQFGKNSSNQNLYWRIIRINGDGSLRLFYAGTSATATESPISATAFNTSTDDQKYVGYTYDNKVSSTIKTALENWYASNFSGKSFESAISDTLFCYDRTISNNNYGAYTRMTNSQTPILTCPQKADAYTVSDDTYGNKNLTYSIGLINLDEARMAGLIQGSSNANSTIYLYKTNSYWTGSPARFYNSTARNEIITYSSSGLYPGVQLNSNTARPIPVINITPEAVETMTGLGTSQNPFVVH